MSFTGEGVDIMFNACNEVEFEGWYSTLEGAIENARNKYTEVDTELTPYEQEIGKGAINFLAI